MEFDVIVVGASSAGLYAAEQLAGAGRRVAVLERQEQLSHARRTLIVTPQLRRLLGYVPREALLHRIHTMSVATQHEAVDIRLRDPDLIIERAAFIQHLAERAEAAGAAMFYGHRFVGLEPHRDGATVLFQGDNNRGGQLSARAVIGADGVASSVAAAADIPRAPSVSILQAEVALPPDWDPGLTKVWFDAEESPYFYWLIPESTEQCVVGLIGNDGAETRVLLQRFLERHGFEAEAYQGARVAMHEPKLRPWTTIGSAPVLLVGDAAGQVKVTTVGGSVTGMWGAQAAAQALAKGTSYGRALRSVKRELDLHWYLRLLLERLDNAGYDHLVGCLTGRGREFLSTYNRDEMARVIWQLPFRQPRLLLLGLRLLFKNSFLRSAVPSAVTPSPE